MCCVWAWSSETSHHATAWHTTSTALEGQVWTVALWSGVGGRCTCADIAEVGRICSVAPLTAVSSCGQQSGDNEIRTFWTSCRSTSELLKHQKAKNKESPRVGPAIQARLLCSTQILGKKEQKRPMGFPRTAFDVREAGATRIAS